MDDSICCFARAQLDRESSRAERIVHCRETEHFDRRQSDAPRGRLLSE